MAQQFIDAEVFLVVDAAGDYAVGNDREAAIAEYENTIQPLADTEGFRIVRCMVKIALPEMVELTGTAPSDGGATLTVAS